MAFDASGTFTRLRGNDSWKGDATAGTRIQSDLHDNNDNDIANGLSECLNRHGKGSPTVDMPWGGFKITNLGNPTQPGDAANRQYVDTVPGWPTAKNIEGANLEGRLNFSAPSGVNGITWTYADVSWVARHSETDKTSNRLVMNNSVAPNTTGDAIGDVFIIDDTGRVNSQGQFTANGSYDGAKWRTIDPGTMNRLSITGASVMAFHTNRVATITNKYAEATLDEMFRVDKGSGPNGSEIALTKKKPTSAENNRVAVTGYMETEPRWSVVLGGGVAETGGSVGSDFAIRGWKDGGTTSFDPVSINRATGHITLGGAVQSSSNTFILGTTGAGNVYLRPNGVANAAGEWRVDYEGSTIATGRTYGGIGYMGRAAANGGYGANVWNFNYGSPYLHAYVDNTYIGAVMWQSDYRMKKDIVPLPSLWDKVKALNPVQYSIRDWGIFTNDDTPRWGFVAHELQETLVESAANGRKDAENEVQNPNPWVVIAALTKALQEAMLRIEALEAA